MKTTSLQGAALSVWSSVLAGVNLVVFVVHVSIVTLAWSQHDVGLLVDIGIVRVEVLAIVVVEDAWFSVVLTQNVHEGPHVSWVHLAVS